MYVAVTNPTEMLSITSDMNATLRARHRWHPHLVMMVAVKNDVEVDGSRAKTPAGKVSPQRLLLASTLALRLYGTCSHGLSAAVADELHDARGPAIDVR